MANECVHAATPSSSVRSGALPVSWPWTSVFTLMGLETVLFAALALAYVQSPFLQSAADDSVNFFSGHPQCASQFFQMTRKACRGMTEGVQAKNIIKKTHNSDVAGIEKDAQRLRRDAAKKLREENERLRTRLQAKLDKVDAHPYETVTASRGHQVPEMYGQVQEKTIWAYWHDPVNCPNSTMCSLPPAVQFCTESVRRNRGSFDYRILHRDEVDRYVNMFELPIHWDSLARPALQKDALMNALLARYGGVALDISAILFRPLDDMWDEMVVQGATFRGYVYRLNGEPWSHAEVTAVWFLMSRREGIFSTAVRNQVIGMGDRVSTHAYRQWYFAFGDQTLLPILSMFNYSLPRCIDDPTVFHHWACPEHELPLWNSTGDVRNDTRIIVEDARDGPQMPFAFSKMATWEVTNDSSPVHPDNNGPGFPMHEAGCDSMKTCWDLVFMRRYRGSNETNRGRPLEFVKLFSAGQEVKHWSRAEIVANNQTYFYNWLKLAGLPEFE